VTNQEYRTLLRKNHLCRQCKRQDAFTLAGHPLCARCTELDTINQRKRRAKDGGEKNRQHSQEVRDRRAALGLCTYCGKRKPPDGRSICNVCSMKQTRRNRERDIANGMNWPRGANGYCWQCNKNKSMDGKKMCPDCYERFRANMARGKQNAEHQ
jgi:hypothetical protein